MSATVSDMGVYFLIILSKTNISPDAALEPFIFLFSSMPLSWYMHLLPFLKFLSFGMSFVFSGFFLIYFLTGGKLLYSVVLVSAIP